MPGKSRHRRDKRVLHNRIKAGSGQPAILASSPVPSQTQETLAPPKAVVASSSVLRPTSKPSATPKLYINRELRTTALLAGIMLVILIVVALISR